MSKYVKVENNQIVSGIVDLPHTWNNISNFHALDIETLLTYGWYPYEEEAADLKENEAILRWDIVIEQSRVIKKTIKRQLTDEEIQQNISSLVQQKWNDIRKKRNALLSDCDWIVLDDTPVSNKDEWKIYRQSLRDMTIALSPEAVIWPVKPAIIPIKPIITTSYDENSNLEITDASSVEASEYTVDDDNTADTI